MRDVLSIIIDMDPLKDDADSSELSMDINTANKTIVVRVVAEHPTAMVVNVVEDVTSVGFQKATKM